MVTAATLEAIHSHLDSEPNDWQARRELADIYEELGRDAEARFQRWLVGNKVEIYMHWARPYRWYWKFLDGVPGDKVSELFGTDDDGYIGRRTRTLAEECLREALERRGYELPHPLPRKQGG